MEAIEIEVQLTKESFFKMVNQFSPDGFNLKKAFDRIDKICNTKKILNYYSSFESFKTAYYKKAETCKKLVP